MELDKYHKLDSSEVESHRVQARSKLNEALENLAAARVLLDDENNQYLPHDITALETAIKKIISKIPK